MENLSELLINAARTTKNTAVKQQLFEYKENNKASFQNAIFLKRPVFDANGNGTYLENQNEFVNRLKHG